MDDYSEMQKLYEGYLGMSYDPGPNAGYAYSQGPHSYSRGQIPTANPGSQGPMTRVPLNSDEETNPVLIKIEQLMKQAHDDEMLYAVHMLGQLKEFIKTI